MSELILHHYAASPFSEKVRLVLGYKGLAWKSVTVPIVLPKPDVVALTGGYRRTPPCSVPVNAVGTQKVVTIEAMAENGMLNKIQKAWVELDVPQCGYCQSGMVMAATALLAAKPNPTDADIDEAMTNICRCGTYQQVRAAIHAAAKA